MSNLRASQNDVKSIVLPEGTLHVWRWPSASSHKRDDIVYVEMDEADGGFKVPSGKSVYSYSRFKTPYVKHWSMHSGFTGNHYTLIDIAHHPEGKKTNRQLRFNDPDVEFISDTLFSLLINDLLPINKIDVQYHLDRQAAIADYYAKTRKIEAIEEELLALREAEAQTTTSYGSSDAIFGGYMPRLKLESY